MNKQILAFVQAKEDGAISPELIDVFCEKGVFEHEDTRRILEASKKAGLEINFHGDEIHPMQYGNGHPQAGTCVRRAPADDQVHPEAA
ncbi:hypothetical protein PF002_g29742 [Phytophthora fragariae]|uniref:Uncharacterized protein n=1 Tax=Phytophthora fragariae TaxID=53985 RepID=A0A6A3PY77_9STRA|nr:hypothetical protein PF009_g29581 [Phytophthora fragariae]KAE9064974.1 hypothetical protein PF007_g29004 [Phytophthora fragariae]KAE9071772.1 hypothetical protein PF006_g29079 [Phytophthora fragariae]KAE9171774.1 hypothetical protein PF002_g29742 [Phytophthora fragariae]KAE9270465.1 hypothetical protein PF001_g28792 [Phytophthora fragariae]